MQPLGAVAGGLLAGLVLTATAGAADYPAADRLKFELRPYDGAALGDPNDYRQTGAELRFGPGAEPELSKEEKLKARLAKLGVKDGVEQFGDKGRWYMFVAGSGQALGLNMNRDPNGLLRSYGVSVDPAAVTGEVQAGVGWRRGPMQASVGYVRREFDQATPTPGLKVDDKDDMVGFTFALKPQR